MTAVVACAVGAALGLAGLVAATRGGTGPIRPPLPWRRLLPPAGVGAVALLVTGWPVAAVLGALAAAGLPRLWGRSTQRRAIDRADAVAGWTEQLRDTMAAASGLSEALVTTAAVAPRPLRDPVSALAARMRSGVALPVALRQLAAEVDDPDLDRVVAALSLAAAAPASRLTELLAALAGATREEVAMRLRVEAGRASARSAVRTVVVFTVTFAAGLAVLARPYLAPFGSAGGQLVLAGVGACYTAGLVLMGRLIASPGRPRLVGGQRW